MVHLLEAALRRLKHRRNDVSEHGNREKTDLLVLADLAEVGDADRQICKRAMVHDCREVVLVKSCNDLERRARDTF